ncbi:MAG: DUF6048 family protein [Cyclobacteriaceae bacterium]
MRYFFSIFMVVFSMHLSFAQQTEPDEADTVRRTWSKRSLLPSVMRIGPAVNELILSALDDKGTYYGFQADVVRGRFMLAAEYGRAELERNSEPGAPPGEEFSYSMNGDFFKLGVDVNMLTDKREGSYEASNDIIFFGLKYAFSSIDDRISFTSRENVWGATTITQSNENLGVRWLEMNAGVKVSVYKNVFLGYTLRYRFARRYIDRSSLVPYRIPGFGGGEDTSNFGFDYYIYYRIPLRKQQLPRER